METINQTYFFEGVTPVEVYEAYMNENQQATYTGSSCSMSDRPGGKCVMHGGYIEAENIELELGKLIKQKWVAKEEDWPPNHQSTLSIKLDPKQNGTELQLVHADVPDPIKDSLEKGWITYYWEPMSDFFK